MGEVYRARDTRLERTVAIKILPAHLSSDPVRKQRFEREAKTISNLNHPHICVLHDIGSQDGVLTPTGAKLLDFGLAKPAAPLLTGATLTAAAQLPPVTADGQQIFFIQPDRKLIAVSFNRTTGMAGAPRVLFQTRIAAERIANWQYDVAPDGRFLINSLPSDTAAPLTLIGGWDVALPGR